MSCAILNFFVIRRLVKNAKNATTEHKNLVEEVWQKMKNAKNRLGIFYPPRAERIDLKPIYSHKTHVYTQIYA